MGSSPEGKHNWELVVDKQVEDKLAVEQHTREEQHILGHRQWQHQRSHLLPQHPKLAHHDSHREREHGQLG